MKMENLVELKITMNTDEGQASFTTENLNGFLYSILVDSPEKCEFIIESSFGYLLLHRHEIDGVQLFYPRGQTTTPIESLLNYPGYEKIHLNEPITITIFGRKNQEVKFLFKIC